MLPVSLGREGIGRELLLDVLISPGPYLFKVICLQLHPYGWCLCVAELLEVHQETDLVIMKYRDFIWPSKMLLFTRTEPPGADL